MNVLITGSAKGLGAGLAVHLGGGGHRVTVTYRGSRDAAEETARRLETAGGDAVLIQGDVSTPEGAQNLVDEASAAMGGIDVLINNVGGFLIRHVDDLTPADWDRQLAATVSATYYMCHAARPHVRASENGRIINLSDSSADKIMARPTTLPYSIGKTGILILTRTLAKTEAPYGVSVNAILPGVLENSDPLPDIDLMPAGRHGTFEDVAGAIDYLIAPDSSYITGTFVHVGGGWNL